MRYCHAFFIILTLMVGWRHAEAADGNAPAALTILFTGDTAGEYLPCGCPGSPMGGFARRATKIQEIRGEGQPVVVVDTGNALWKGGLVRVEPDDGTRRHARFVGQLLKLAGTQAVAVGPRDLWALGAENLKRLALETGVPWLSANLVSGSGKPVFPTNVTLKVGALRVGVIGVTKPLPAVLSGTGLRFSDPVAATRAVVEALRPNVDLLLILCNVGYEQQEDLRGIPGVDLVLAGAPEEGVPEVTADHPPAVIRVHGLGRTLGRVDLKLVVPPGSPPARSVVLERQLRELVGIQGELETLKRTIIEEEGAFDRARWDRESAYLRGKYQELKQNVREAPVSRSVFAYQELVLFERIPPDPRVQRRIDAYERSGGS